MRVFPRIALTVLALAVVAAPAFSQPLQSNCPLTLVASNPPASAFGQSPHGAFRSGSLVFVLRGQTLTTYTVTDLGDMQIAREDFISDLANRNPVGGVAFANGFLYVSSESGLEIYDLSNVRAGGSAPVRRSRVAGLNYRRLTVSGTTLAGLFPGTDLPCAPASTGCGTVIDFWNVGNASAPFRTGSLSSSTNTFFGSFNDIAFNYTNLIATGTGGTFSISPATLRSINTDATVGTFLVSNGTSLVAVGNDSAIVTFGMSPSGVFSPLTYHSIATLQVGRANRIVYHPQGFIDDPNARLIMMVDELDRERLQPARTIAFDVFDYTVPMYEGRDPRVYESVSYLNGDEVKYNPVAVGPLVYVVGEVTGLQTYGDCGQLAGRIEFDSPAALPCGGAEIHGWVTSASKVTGVELFLDAASLGFATVGGLPRSDVAASTPVLTWRASVLLDQTTKGLHVLRAIGTDILGNRRQFASQNVFFPGPGQNCANRRRSASH